MFYPEQLITTTAILLSLVFPLLLTLLSFTEVNRRDFVLKALGSQSEADALMERIQGAADEQGMSINWNGNFGPVQNAHKLVALALRRHGVAVQARVVERLFHDQFVLGKDIFDDDLLVRVGREAAGLDEDDVRLELADQDAGKRLDREIDHAREIKGIDAVPHVIVLNRFKVGGYQEKEVYEDLFNKIFMERIL